MAKQLTCLLVMVLALVFVWADDGVTSTTAAPGIVTTIASNNVTATALPTLKVSDNSSDTVPTTLPTPAPVLGVGGGTNCDAVEDALNCTTCVLNNCTYVMESYGAKCTNDSAAGDQFTLWISHTVAECPANDNTTSTTPATTTTQAPATTNATTPTPTTTTTTTTTTSPPTNATTTVPTTPTTPTTTTKPAATTTPAPSKDASWGWGPFFAGIAFAAGLSSVGYVLWRFYKVRTERNYHTL